VDVLRDIARFDAGDDDGRPRRQIRGEGPTKSFDDRTRVAPRQQTQLANQRDLLTCKGTFG